MNLSVQGPVGQGPDRGLAERRRMPQLKLTKERAVAIYLGLLFLYFAVLFLAFELREHISFLPSSYFVLSVKRLMALSALSAILTLPALFLVRSRAILAVLLMLVAAVPLTARRDMFVGRKSPSLEAKGAQLIAGNNPYLDKVAIIRELKAKSESADALWSTLSTQFMADIDRSNPANARELTTRAMLIVSSFYDYGNAQLKNKRKGGCAILNEQTDFKPLTPTFKAYRDAQIGCCSDFSAMLASFLTWLRIENMFVTMPGHIANKVFFDGEWHFVDANTNTIIQGVFEEGGPRPDLRIAYFPHPNNLPEIGRYDIYNYIELREELGAALFRTTSDTEVIIKAYERWGENCVSRLRGMFAFAIWDNIERTVFLARDRFGIKPLYWANTSRGLFFASEIKALLPFLDRREIDAAAFSDYFSFQFCIGEKTMLTDVAQFPAAHRATVRLGEVPNPKRYWEVQYTIDYSHTQKWFSERLQELMHDSIRMHLRADVEIGSYLSGGIDSSLVATLAREQRPDGRFQAFNGRFLDGKDFDESHYAKAVADQNRMDLHVTDISEQDFVDNIAKVIWHMDQPNAGPGSFPQYLVSKNVRNHVKVVLGGQGGDEIFGGYARYLIAYFEQCIKGAIEGSLHDGKYVVSYESIIPNLVSLQQYKPMLREFWSDGLFNGRDERYWRLVNRTNTFGEILAPGVIDQTGTFERFKSIFWGANVGKESYFDSMTHFDFKTLLPALLQVEDRMSMAHGIEARVPFLDHPLIEFAATVPADIKFAGGELKRMPRAVFSDKLPVALLNRKDKMGFPVPLNLWLKKKGQARELVGDLLGSATAQSRPYLRNGLPVDKLLDSQSVYSRNIWALLSLELWHRSVVDG